MSGQINEWTTCVYLQDAISQLSVSVDTHDSDRITRELETAESAKTELRTQVDQLKEEKERVSQSAWAAQGEIQVRLSVYLTLRKIAI